MAPTSRLENPSTRVYSSPKPTQPDSSTMGELRESPQNSVRSGFSRVLAAAFMGRAFYGGNPGEEKRKRRSRKLRDRRGPWPRLFELGGVVEDLRQANAAVASLRECRIVAIAGIQVRRGVIRREQHERVQELEDRVLGALRKLRERIARGSRLATVAQDDFAQIDAAPVMSVRR